MPYWQLNKGEIVALADGVPHAVTAAELFEAQFGTSRPRDERPTSDLPQLKMSRFPCVLQLVLDANPEDFRLPIRLSACVQLPGGGTAPIDKVPASDHVVVGEEWYPLTEADFRDVASCLDELDVVPPTGLTISQYLQVKRRLAPGELAVDRVGQQLSADDMSTMLPSADTPGLKAELYPYQLRGYSWLVALSSQGVGCVLGDEMGLGKTLQAIALLLHEARAERKPNLVIAPSTLLENWRREVVRFAPEMEVCVHAGARRTGSPRSLRRWDLVITSYDTLRSDLSLFEMIRWNTIALDEAQAIKNPDALRTDACKAMQRRFALAITGTPLQNSLLDLWSIVDFCVPGMLGPSEPYRGDGGVDSQKAKELESLVSPLMLRRSVDMVGADLPSRVDIPEALLMNNVEAEQYEELRSQESAKQALSSLVRLRMFCTHPDIVADSERPSVSAPGSDRDPCEASNKYQRLVEIIEAVLTSGERALIFASYTKMIEMMARDLNLRLGCRIGVVYGSVGSDQRQAAVDALNDSRLDVLVLNPQVGGTGLNITGANHVVHYNLEWNPATVDQATARAHRHGQTRPVFVHYLYYADTVEEVILQRLERKRALASTAVKGVDGEAMETQDIMRALSLSPVHEGSS